MKTSILKITFLLAIAGLTMISCKKKEGCTDPAAENYDAEAKKPCDNCCEYHVHDDGHTHTPTKDTATINLTSPSVSAMYNNADTVFINATVTRATDMHGYDYTLKKVSDQSLVHSGASASHAKNYTVSDFWVNNVASHTDMEFTLTIYLTHDHNENQVIKRTIHCHP